MGGTGSATDSTGVLLTSRRNSLAASRRRNDGGGEESKAAARVCGTRTSEGGGSDEGVQGRRRALNSPDLALACGPRTGTRARVGLGRRGGGGGVRGEDELVLGDDTGAPRVSDRGGGGERLAQLGLAAGWLGRRPAGLCAAARGCRAGKAWLGWKGGKG
jgi:hypothetical protein